MLCAKKIFFLNNPPRPLYSPVVLVYVAKVKSFCVMGIQSAWMCVITYQKWRLLSSEWYVSYILQNNFLVYQDNCLKFGMLKAGILLLIHFFKSEYKAETFSGL